MFRELGPDRRRDSGIGVDFDQWVQRIHYARGADHPGAAVEGFCTGVLTTLTIKILRLLRDIVLLPLPPAVA